MALVAAKKRSPVQRYSADVNSASKADKSADAENSMFQLQTVQSTDAVSYAGVVVQRQVPPCGSPWSFHSRRSWTTLLT